jgi:hypothetical protein
MWGCSITGPRHIGRGRAEYNEVINRTEDEQMLLAIVKGRYGETSSLLAVNGLAANVRFITTAGVEAGFGSVKGDNLLIGGLAYEENPTITYTPVQGEDYFRQLMTPIPLDILLMMVRSVTNGNRLFALLVDRVNNLRNPEFISASQRESNEKFQRFIELITELSQVSVLELAGDKQEEIAFNFVINDYANRYSNQIRELFDMLELPYPGGETRDIVIPVYFRIETGKFQGIAITTRSTFDLIEILRASIVVPHEHFIGGLTINYPQMGLPGQGVRILSSKEKPRNLSLAVKYRRHWFYIDETDQHTKSVFRVLRTFWSFSTTAEEDFGDAPILTIPVSR